MTPKQILDSFSETLLQDDRILSVQERALVTSLVQHAKAATGANEQTQETVRSVIASAVGEIVAQRAFAVLGGSVVERILGQGAALPSTEGTRREIEFLGPPRDPQPPTGPHTAPGVKAPAKDPQPPHPSPTGPQSPGHGQTTAVVSRAEVAVAEKPQTLRAQSVVLDEFLSPEELAGLTRFIVE